MSQINRLRQIDGAATTLVITKGARLQFSIYFPQPVGPQAYLLAAGTVTSGSATITGLPAATVAALVTGQPAVGYGLPAGASVVGIPSATSVTLSAAATQSGLAVSVTFHPLPLDLTGIDFLMQVREAASASGVRLEMSTSNGRLRNGGTSGVLSALVEPEDLVALPVTGGAVALVTDIRASASDGGPYNLMAQSGPASVIVNQAVSRA